MKCEIIKDLLPAYCDCVCSLETAAEIEQHTANCDSCKKLLEDYRSDIEPLNKVEPEKPFRKIKRKIFRSKSAVISLIILLVIVLSAVGYLTYGQIVRSPFHPSFETIISSQKAKKLTKKFCEGDIDYVMDNIQIYQTGVALYTNPDEIREYCRSVLADFYEKYLNGKNLQMKISSLSGYDCYQFENATDPMTIVQLFDGDIDIFSLNIYEQSGGKFLMSCNGYYTDVINEADVNTFNLALNPVEPRADWETAILNNSRDNEHLGFVTDSFAETQEEEKILRENAAALMKVFKCEKAYYSDFTFDVENSRYLIDIGFIFQEKSSGKRVSYYRTIQITRAGILNYEFKILPEFKPVIFDDGISAENREMLENLFVC